MLHKLLEQADTVAISGHIRPDGDCVGACMGLYQYIKGCFPKICADVYLEEIPEVFGFIKGTKDIRHEIPEDKSYDLFICLDCGDEGRLGFAAPLFEQAKTTCCVDHHVSNQAFADHNYIVPDASSTSELIFRLIEEDQITFEIAEALYMGIAHDTGVFQYSCAKPETFRVAAKLLEKGIDAPAIIDHTYYEKTYAQNKVLAQAILKSRLLFDGKGIVSFITREEMERLGVTASDLEGIVSQLRIVKGVEVAAFLYELEENVYKVSLRSKRYADVSKVAQYFGGGGHIKAAGCSVEGTPEEIIRKLEEQLVNQLSINEGSV